MRSSINLRASSKVKSVLVRASRQPSFSSPHKPRIHKSGCNKPNSHESVDLGCGSTGTHSSYGFGPATGGFAEFTEYADFGEGFDRLTRSTFILGSNGMGLLNLVRRQRPSSFGVNRADAIGPAILDADITDPEPLSSGCSKFYIGRIESQNVRL